MDWILSDIGGLNSSKELEIDSDRNRHNHFGDDAEKEQKAPEKCQKGSDAKWVQREKGPTQNGTLRNNNNKNYQDKELTINKSSSSNQNKLKDPFADDSETDDDEEVITGLIKMFSNEAHVSIPNYQYNHIKNSLLAMDQSDAIDLMYTVVNKVSQGEVQNPIGYLITSIASVKGGE